ncbi:MAG TPA: hypothetical protein VIC08_06305 [Cellvibrionaceae bacterium]
MPEIQITANDVLGSREIHFNNRQESMYPHLMRFCMDFKFRVLQLLLAHGAPGNGKLFILIGADYKGDPIAAITPPTESLAQLETLVRQRQTDILHDYLFGVEGLYGAEGSG